MGKHQHEFAEQLKEARELAAGALAVAGAEDLSRHGRKLDQTGEATALSTSQHNELFYVIASCVQCGMMSDGHIGTGNQHKRLEAFLQGSDGETFLDECAGLIAALDENVTLPEATGQLLSGRTSAT